MTTVTHEMLDGLRQRVMSSMSQKRAIHTLAVEDMIVRLSELYCPEHCMQLRAAALLHDITKELKAEEQIALCSAYGIDLTAADLHSPKTHHARTAAERIKRDFPEFADPIIIDAVRWHTTGHAGMTLTEKLLYLADYIDLSRTFPSCVLLRRYFFGAKPEEMNREEKDALLCDTLLLSYDLTVKDLLAEGKLVASDTVDARNELLIEASARKSY